MKFSKSCFSLVEVMIVLAIIGLLAAFTLTAKAQYQPNFYQNILTNGTVQIATAAATNTSALSKPVYVRQGKGISFLPYCAGTNSATANTWYFFDVTADGTNWSTTMPLQGSVALNGTTGSRGYILFDYSELDNVRAIRLAQITNAHTATIWVTNVVASYSNQ